jgi:bile acid-coenzyme A ligase
MQGLAGKSDRAGPADPTLGSEAIISWCRERVAHFKAVRGVTFLHELPRSEAGKVQRGALLASLGGSPRPDALEE